MKRFWWHKRRDGTELGHNWRRKVKGTSLFTLYVELYHSKVCTAQQSQSLALSWQGFWAGAVRQEIIVWKSAQFRSEPTQWAAVTQKDRQDMPLWKNTSRVFCLLLLKTLSLVLIILPLWAYELLGTFCFFSFSCTTSVSSVSGCQLPNCPVLGLLLMMLNAEALKPMVSVTLTNVCITSVIIQCRVPKGKPEPSLPPAMQ